LFSELEEKDEKLTLTAGDLIGNKEPGVAGITVTQAGTPWERVSQNGIPMKRENGSCPMI